MLVDLISVLLSDFSQLLEYLLSVVFDLVLYSLADLSVDEPIDLPLHFLRQHWFLIVWLLVDDLLFLVWFLLYWLLSLSGISSRIESAW